MTVIEPKLGFLILTRDIIQDSITGELTAIRLFDTLYIDKNRDELAYSPNFLGRIFLNGTGIFAKVQTKLTITDPEGLLMGEGIILTVNNINAALGINLICRYWPLVFTKEGTYETRVAVSVNNEPYIDVPSPIYFQVSKRK